MHTAKGRSAARRRSLLQRGGGHGMPQVRPPAKCGLGIGECNESFRKTSSYFLLSSPVTIQSMLLPECAFRLRRTSNVVSFWPFSYFDSCAWPIPRISPNAAWVRSNPRISLMRRPIACGSTRTLVFFLIIFSQVVHYAS